MFTKLLAILLFAALASVLVMTVSACEPQPEPQPELDGGGQYTSAMIDGGVARELCIPDPYYNGHPRFHGKVFICAESGKPCYLPGGWDDDPICPLEGERV